ncbi:M23 family metallopeptidase [Chryseobacterium sp.]|uniref:M23 family metallopeptidase n=1 Tax=Chryseobacterium sp. TaxID=1871047 RepID=UPI0025C07C76|nr:M23 family metallopeptidase [Chryseobacterium sp.]
MESKIKKVFFVILVLAYHFSYAQFNTLTPTQPKKSESLKVKEKPGLEENAKEKKDKKSWKQIFNITTKSDLKNEIDSLKTLIKEYSSVSSNKNSQVEKLKDSVALLTQNRLMQKKNISNKPNGFAMYDLVEEPKETFSKIVMPLNNRITITSSYGARIHPIFGTKKMHNGIDLKANYENVYCVMDGIVTAVGWDSKGGGNYIKVNHFNRFETSYLHLSEMYYRVGEQVKAGYIIGKSGNTGNSTGPHLHFSVKEFGKSINPAHFLNDLIKVNNLIAIYNE